MTKSEINFLYNAADTACIDAFQAVAAANNVYHVAKKASLAANRIKVSACQTYVIINSIRINTNKTPDLIDSDNYRQKIAAEVFNQRRPR